MKRHTRKPHPNDMVTEAELAATMAESVETPERRIQRLQRKNTAQMGKREERAIVKLLESAGVRARRVPGSGSIEGLDHDVLFWAQDTEYSIEVKARKKSGWKTLERWRAGADILVLVEMQQSPGETKPSPRVFMDWELFADLLGAYARDTSSARSVPGDYPNPTG